MLQGGKRVGEEGGGGNSKVSVCCNVREIFRYQVCTRYTGFLNYCRQWYILPSSHGQKLSIN